MRIVTIPGYCVPLLLHGVWDDDNSKLNDVYLLAYLGNRWIDLGSLTNEMLPTDGERMALSDVINDRITGFVDDIVDKMGNIHGLDDVLRLFFHHIDGGEINELPATDLEDIWPQATDVFDDLISDADIDAQPRLSRPKPDEAQVAA